MFKLTDGRPWYKQAVMGIVYSVILIVCTPLALLASALIYQLCTNAVFIEAIRVLGQAAGVIILIFITASIIEWAAE